MVVATTTPAEVSKPEEEDTKITIWEARKCLAKATSITVQALHPWEAKAMAMQIKQVPKQMVTTNLFPTTPAATTRLNSANSSSKAIVPTLIGARMLTASKN